MDSNRIKFHNKNGQELSAKLDLPLDQKPKAYAIFAHCFTCNKNLKSVSNISRKLTANGIAVLRFDFTGLGQSEGEFEETNFSHNVDDLLSAADYLKENHSAPTLLVGHSLGGAAVIYAAQAINSIKAIATIGAPSSPQHVSHLFEQSIEEIKKEGKAKVNLGGRPFTIQHQFIEDLEKRNLPECLSSMRKALIILHSPQDSTVGIQNAAELYQSAHHPKSFISLNGADHLLSNSEDSLYVGEVISTWAKKYLNFKADKTLTTDSQVATATGNENYTTEIKAGNHSLTADEPTDVGGLDLGPTPYGYLLSGLGACTSMTLQMYAKRKEWNLEKAIVHLEHNKVHAEDCESCETKTGKIDEISRKIELIGNLTDEQKSKLMEIADKCPVHKTLTGEIKVTTSLTD